MCISTRFRTMRETILKEIRNKGKGIIMEVTDSTNKIKSNEDKCYELSFNFKDSYITLKDHWGYRSVEIEIEDIEMLAEELIRFANGLKRGENTE